MLAHVNPKKGKNKNATYDIEYGDGETSLQEVVAKEKGSSTVTSRTTSGFLGYPYNKRVDIKRSANKLTQLLKDDKTPIRAKDKDLTISKLLQVKDPQVIVNNTPVGVMEDLIQQVEEIAPDNAQGITIIQEKIRSKAEAGLFKNPDVVLDNTDNMSLDDIKNELYLELQYLNASIIEDKDNIDSAGSEDSNVEQELIDRDAKTGVDIKLERDKKEEKQQKRSLFNSVIDKLMSTYNLKDKPTVVSLEQLKDLVLRGPSNQAGPGFSGPKIPTSMINVLDLLRDYGHTQANLANEQSLRDTLKAVIESMESGGVKGSVITARYLKTPIIIMKNKGALNISIKEFQQLNLKDRKALLGEVMVGLHEYGHLVFKQEFANLQLDSNKHIKKRLWKAFTATRNSLYKSNQNVAQYEQENQKLAFEEWYADQVAAYVTGIINKETKKPKSLVDRYFKKIAQTFADIFKNINSLWRRFKLDTTFQEYFDGVLEAQNKVNDINRVTAKDPSVTEDIVVDNYISDIKLRVPPSAVKKLTAAVRKVLSVGDGAYLQKFLKIAAPVTTFYRNLGPYGEKLANFWNKKSQTEGPEGYNDVRVTKRNEFLNALEDIVGLPVNRWGELEQLFELVEDDTKATDTLPPKARKIREFLSKTIYDDYVINPKTGEPFIQSMEYEIDPVTGAPVIDPATGKKIEIGKKSMGKLKDYYPRLLNVAEVSRDPSFFIDLLYEELLIARKNGNIESVLGIDMQNATDEDLQKRAHEVVSKIANKAVEHGSALELGNDGISEVAMDTISQRTLSWITTSKIRAYERRRNISGNILLPAHYAILPYISQVVKKVEFERRGGIEYLNSLVEKIIKERHPQDAVKRAKLKKELEDSFDGQLGRTGTDIKEGYKTFNSIATVWTVFTTLSMATLSSFTDLGAIATRSKEFGNVRDLIRDLKSNMSMEEFKQLSRDLGVTSSDAIASAYLTPGDLDWQQEWASSSLDWFFKATLLTQYTNFTRELAVGMGKRFIINSAVRDTKRNTRYLAELGLTPAEVKQWQADGENFNSEVGRKVGSAIRQFADESIIRPNPGERPSWANSPYLQIVFSLKSYFYSYGTTVLGGMGREFKNRYREDGHINGGAALLLLGAGTMLPLAMIGVESREWIKYLGQTALPGVDASREVFRSDFMSWPEYISDILNRAGIYGPWTIAESMWSGINHGDNPFVSQIPIVDMADSVLFEDNLARAFPFINNFGVKF